MSVRSFSIFLDAPSDQTLELTTTTALSPDFPRPKPLATLFDPFIDNSDGSSYTTPTFSVEKENVHPVTGAKTTQVQPKKKQKILGESSSKAVLAPKPQAAAGSAGSLKLKKSKVEGKRRKVLGLSGSSAPSLKPASRSRKEKERRPLGSMAAPQSVPLTPGSELAAGTSSLVLDASETLSARAHQAVIDSRCRELTVSPLANVSAAFGASSQAFGTSDGEGESASSMGEFRTTKDSGFESQMRDYFSQKSLENLSTPSLSRTSSKGSLALHHPGFVVYRDPPATTKAAEPEPRADPAIASEVQDSQSMTDEATINPSVELTTPQRKVLYSAFTFATPEQNSQL